MTRPLHIVCDPNPFCYGSISALRAVAHHLPEARLTVLATGPVREQCDAATFAQVIPCDVKNPASVRQTRPQWETADLYLAVSNNTNIDLVLEWGMPLVFIDILFWMKRRVTSAMRHAHSYIIENFPGVAETLRQYEREMHRPRVVGPLISASPHRTWRPGTSQLLVNYGGAHSPDIIPGKNTCYPSSMTRLVQELLSDLGWPGEAVTIAAGARAVARIREDGVDGGLRVRTLPQPEYLELMATSHHLLTAPGLNAPFEGFALGVPTSFLPPQNLTQVCQLAVYQEQGLAPRGLNLTELYPDHAILPQAPEAEGTARVLELVTRLDTDRSAREAVRQRVVAQLLRGHAERERQLAAQRLFLERLGPPGCEEAASELRQVLARPSSRPHVPT
ncbi:hypothetical protein CYFUS_001221 [Cystobacter fuscus]|uniref:Uncharacterized protein n=1 Tax=Cystobacter fuscus TaxID=43 RepID=A0A250IX66_9BACT|nr:hypothetical protein [Cystobacter fuscus]ATB35807.1 hypothetical protein CYFUS_001221 [Cystobacter fuscus]